MWVKEDPEFHVPDVNLAQFMIDNMKKYGDTVALVSSLWKHAYWNILKILRPKNETFLDKNSDIFHISAQNIDCGYSLELPRRGGSNEYPQFMFLSRNK